MSKPLRRSFGILGVFVMVGCGHEHEATLPPTTPATVVVSSSASSSTSSSSSSTSTTTTLAWQRFPTTSPQRPSQRVIRSIDTTDPVVFLTIDDGFTRDPRIPELLAEHGATATLFVVPAAVKADPAYFARFIELGGSVNSHTVHHDLVEGMPEAEQRREICNAAKRLGDLLGTPAGHYFRPPYGEWDSASVRAARSCGLDRVVLWDVSVNEGQIVRLGGAVQAGDILILHFREELYTDLEAVFAELDRLGLSVARLEDYLPAD